MPAILVSMTSRDSRVDSAFARVSSRTWPSNTPPFSVRDGAFFAKSARSLATFATSPVTNAIAIGPSSIGMRSSRPTSFAAIVASVFFTTLSSAEPASRRRSSLSSATLSPRYSVSSTGPEVNRVLTSATAWTLVERGPPSGRRGPPSFLRVFGPVLIFATYSSRSPANQKRPPKTSRRPLARSGLGRLPVTPGA